MEKIAALLLTIVLAAHEIAALGNLPSSVSLDKMKSFIAAQRNISHPTLSPIIVQLNPIPNAIEDTVPCTCAVFLSGQFVKGSPQPPQGLPALIQEQDTAFACSNLGVKQCTNKCLDSLVKHLPNSPAIVCGSIDRDCYKERAYLFVQNCNAKWINTNLSAGREYCCKDGVSYKCPLV